LVFIRDSGNDTLQEAGYTNNNSSSNNNNNNNNGKGALLPEEQPKVATEQEGGWADPLAGLNGFGGAKNLLHQQTIRGSIPGKARPSLSPRHPERPWGQLTLLFTAYWRLSARGLKRPRSEDERSSRPSAHVKNKWSRTCTPHLPLR
jgi:hypothetical protein